MYSVQKLNIFFRVNAKSLVCANAFLLMPFKDMEISIRELKTILNRVVARREFRCYLNILCLNIPSILLDATFDCSFFSSHPIS